MFVAVFQRFALVNIKLQTEQIKLAWIYVFVSLCVYCLVHESKDHCEI